MTPVKDKEVAMRRAQPKSTAATQRLQPESYKLETNWIPAKIEWIKKENRIDKQT